MATEDNNYMYNEESLQPNKRLFIKSFLKMSPNEYHVILAKEKRRGRGEIAK